jgi:hypothetical protein
MSHSRTRDAGSADRPHHTTNSPTGCLLGALEPDGHRYLAVPVAEPVDPVDMIKELRQFWRHTAQGEPGVFTNLLLRHGWRLLGTDRRRLPGRTATSGLGVPDPAATAMVGDLHHTSEHPLPGWLYLLDHDWEQVRCYEATVHRRWLPHSRHDLAAPPTQPVVTAPYGDAATTAGRGHRWRPGTVGLDGLATAWPAEICTIEHARGLTVARLHPDILTHIIDITTASYHDRRPGSALPMLHLDNQQMLHVVWYPGSGHEQHLAIPPDEHGRTVIGPQVLPWTQPADTPPMPGHQSGVLRNGIPPLHEWVTEAGFHACHPILADYPLPLICAAVATLSPHTPAVLAPAHHYGPVWLPAPSHALMLAAGGDPGDGTVTLPRPLGGSWTSDPPARVLTGEQVATCCARIQAGYTTLTTAPAEPTT